MASVTPYTTLKNAVRARGGATTPGEVRRELAAYLSQFKVKSPIDWSQVMTRAEWHEKHFTKKGTRRARRKKGESDPVLLHYDAINDSRVEAKRHNPILDETFADDFKWLDEFRKRGDDDGYNGSF